MKKRINKLYVICGLSIVLIVSSCVSTSKKQQLRQQYPVWPAAPAEARVKLVDIFSLPDDLNIGGGFWQWLGDMLLGSDVQSMIRPMAIVSNDGKQIYVADPGIYGVHLFDVEKQHYQLIKLADNQNMLSPVALSLGQDNDVFITDSKTAQVYRYHYGDEYASVVELEEGLQQPTGILIDKSEGNLFIVDTKRHQVLVYDSTGNLSSVIGRRGTGNGEFNYPTMLAWDEHGNLLVTDSLNFRIQAFTKTGHYIKQFGQLGDATGYQARPKGVSTDSNGNIYVVDSLFHNVQIFNTQGEYLLSIGEQGSAPGQFWLPTGIFIDHQQKIYVADSHNQRVQVFQLVKAMQ